MSGSLGVREAEYPRGLGGEDTGLGGGMGEHKIPLLLW